MECFCESLDFDGSLTCRENVTSCIHVHAGSKTKGKDYHLPGLSARLSRQSGELAMVCLCLVLTSCLAHTHACS